MSVWSSAKGTVRINLCEKFSLKKYTKSLYDEVQFNEVKYGTPINDIDVIEFELSVCLSGMGAGEFFNEWALGIPGSVDMICELRIVR